MESEIWSTLHTARIANAGFFIFTMFSIKKELNIEHLFKLTKALEEMGY